MQGRDALANQSRLRAVGRRARRSAARPSAPSSAARMRAFVDGQSLILGVSGEAGIGKTSLIEDFLVELTSRPERPIVARGRCSERLAGAEAYLPILEALDNLLHRAGGESLQTLMKTVAPTWYLQVATRSIEESSMAELRVDALTASQERMKREVGAFFQDVSSSRPVVLFLDDLHWADVSTIDILNYLAGRFADMRVLVLTTYRPAEMALAQHPFLGIAEQPAIARPVRGDRPRVSRAGDVDRYLALEFPEHRLPPDFSALIHAKTEGSPLFMADLVRYLRDSGGIVEQNGTWVLARSMSDMPRDLPESVRSMIARKIEQVDERDRALLLAASVQGHEFDSAIVSEAIEMDPADVEERLDVLERVHVFVKRGNEYEFPGPDPDAAVSVRARARIRTCSTRRCSRRGGRRSAAVSPGRSSAHGEDTPASAARLAVLFEAARDFAASARYYFVAAQHAVGLFAFREALSLAERGLKALRGLPDGPAAQAAGARPADDPRAGAADDEGVGRRGARAGLRARPRAVSRARRSAGSVSRCGGRSRSSTRSAATCASTASARDELMIQAEQSGNPAYLMAAHHLVGVSREFLGDMVESSRCSIAAVSCTCPPST